MIRGHAHGLVFNCRHSNEGGTDCGDCSAYLEGQEDLDWVDPVIFAQNRLRQISTIELSTPESLILAPEMCL